MKRLSAATLGLMVWVLPLTASAYCRTTICDARYSCDERPEICCIQDDNGCDMNTEAISWPTSCVSYNVHEAGSTTRGISADQLADVLDASFDQWLSADCGGDQISLAVDYRGKAQCGQPEYNQDDKDGNANVWMFRDSGTTTGSSSEFSALDDSALAVTTVMFNENTAEIYDVDVELLSAGAEFTVTDDESEVRVDLQSVVAHEAGHFLGLDHSLFPDATMKRGYFPGCPGEQGSAQGDCMEPRTLTEDDRAGICAAYPEGRSFPGGRTCEPRGEYSTECLEDQGGCGCSAAGSDKNSPRAAWLLSILGALAVGRRRQGRRA